MWDFILYLFAEDQDVVARMLNGTSSGDAEVNDCAIHPVFPELPFGGVGNSGMGKYQGGWAFTNARGVLYRSTKLDPGVRYLKAHFRTQAHQQTDAIDK